MSDKRLTAVSWLQEQFHKVPFSQFGNLFEQAKALEREQIEKDITFLNEIKKRLIKYREKRDVTEFEMVLNMVDDWVLEINELYEQ